METIRISLFICALVFVACTTEGAIAQDHPKVEILQPVGGEVLAGDVDVHVKCHVHITPPADSSLPSSVYAGLGGPPWVRLERVEESNEWKGDLDTTMVPNGSHALIVMTDDTSFWDGVTRQRGTGASQQVTVENPIKVFFADLHSHSNYSDGTFPPSVGYSYARDVAKLDVFSLTDHLEHLDDAAWLDSRETAWNANVDGKFVAFPGLEWTKGQHACILDPKTRHWPEDLAAFYQAAAEAGVIVKFNHPTGDELFDRFAYSEVGDKAVQLIEVHSRKPSAEGIAYFKELALKNVWHMASEESAYILALKNGWHLAPDGSDDQHKAKWGNCGTWTAILAPGLSKRNIMDALRRRRVYSTSDRNGHLTFHVNGAVMGTVLPQPIEHLQAVIVVEDPDKDDAIAKIELFEDGIVVQTDEPNAARRHWEPTYSPEPGSHYYFVKITQTDGNVMLSAPVWVTVGAAQVGE